MFENHWFGNAKRAITIYWEPLHMSEWNGENFTYEVQSMSQPLNSDGTKAKLNSNALRTKQFFANIPNLEADRSYTFKIITLNSVGMKPDVYSTLYIERKSRLPAKPKSIMVKQMRNGSYSVSWKMNDKEEVPVKSFTVFWCQRHTFSRCDKPFSWIDVPKNQTSIVIDVSGKSNAFYHFSVSSNSEGASSGMIWATCMISTDGAPGRVQQIRAEPISPTQLKVNWKLGCMQESNTVKGYYIHDCKSVDGQKCSEPMNRQFVKGNSFLLINREPHSSYRIMVSSVSLSNEEGILSDPYVVKMPEGIPGAPDVPRLMNVTSTSIAVAWKQPSVTNGVIKYYTLHYNSYSIKVNFMHNATLTDSISPFKDYTVSVSACTSKGCSELSSAIKIKTEIGAPSKMPAPRYELINATHVKVYWENPEFANGPLDRCQLSIMWTDKNKTGGKNYTFLSWKNGTYVQIDCSSLESSGKYYNLRVRAGNLFGLNNSLYGSWSETTKVKMCIDVVKAKQRMEAIHKVNIQLPKGLGEITKLMVHGKAMSKEIESVYKKSSDAAPLNTAFKTQTSNQSSDSGIPSDSDYYGSPLPSPGRLCFEDSNQRNGKCVPIATNSVLIYDQNEAEDDINNNSNKKRNRENAFHPENKVKLKLELTDKKLPESSETSTDSMVGLALTGDIGISVYHKFGQFSTKEEGYSLNKGVVSKLNRSIAGSESNIADADGEHGSDTFNDDTCGNSLSHYAYFGLSNSYTDISGNRFCGEVNNVKFLKGNFKSNEADDLNEKSNCKKASACRAPYSKFGLLNIYVKQPPLEPKVQQLNSTKGSNPGYIGMNEIKHLRPSSRENESDHLTVSEGSDDDIPVFLRPGEEKCDPSESPKPRSKCRAYRDSGVSVSSPTKESVNFNGYVPNYIFTPNPKRDNGGNFQHKATPSIGYVPPNSSIENLDKDIYSLVSPSKRCEDSSTGYIPHELFLKTNNDLSNLTRDPTLNSTNQRSIWV
ncbi:Cytokine receptor [Nymphon striatum]|nr:Cytokine receptor [Nymphon striatum]